MSDYGKSFEILLRHEGTVYTDDPDDEGGPTKFGVTIPVYAEFLGLTVTPADIEALGVETAYEVFRVLWWDRHKYYNIVSTDIAARIMLASIHLGPGRGHRAAQRACRACGHRIAEDGIIGPISKRTINEIPSVIYVAALRSEVASYYRRIWDKEPEKKKKWRGWENRAYY